MLITTDIPDELAARIDALVKDPVQPDWPFSTRALKLDSLSPGDRKKLEAYHAAYAAYEAAASDPDRLKSRSAVVRMILNRFFANGNGSL